MYSVGYAGGGIGGGTGYAAGGGMGGGGAARVAGPSATCSDESCGVGCGGAGSGANLGFVGSGRGAYIQETTYQYVGAGRGELDYVAPAPKQNYCVCIVGVAILLLLPLLLWLLFGDTTATTTSDPYDCDAGLGNFQMGWSVSKKMYCCNKYSKGCPPVPTQPPYVPPAPAPMPVPVPVPVLAPPPYVPASTSSCPYNCDAGYAEWPDQWVKGWGGAKKLYCCRTAKKGCPSQLPPPSGIPASGIPAAPDAGPYDCQAGYHPCFTCLVKHWSANKLNWCCHHKNLGCQSNTPAHM